MYREWLSACSCSTADRRGAIAALLHTLPPENFHNLKYFLAFLHHVSLNADVNKMTASNLAIVMAPNLIFEAVAAAEASAASQSVTFEFGVLFCFWLTHLPSPGEEMDIGGVVIILTLFSYLAQWLLVVCAV